MKQLIKTWTKTSHEVDTETGKQGKVILTEIMSIYKVGKREIAEVETIGDDIYINYSGDVSGGDSNAKLFIETPEMEGGITKKEYAALVAAALPKVDEAKLKTAVFKAAYKIQRQIKSPSLFYSPDYINVAVEIYKTL